MEMAPSVTVLLVISCLLPAKSVISRITPFAFSLLDAVRVK